MAYKVIKSKGSISGLTHREFIVDTAAEITGLPTNKKMGKKQTGDTVSDEMCAVGSTASVTETGYIYELNAGGTWVKKPAEGSGEGSDITIDPTLTQEGQAADAKAVGDVLAKKVDASALSNYVQTSTAEGTYAKKTELSAYATTESLSDYMQTSAADTKYATKTELGSYATTESLGSYIQTATADGKYAAKTDLADYATTASLSDYATTSSLSSYMQTSTAESTYAKKTDLSGYATTESLDNYIQTTTADGKYATKSELGSYATTASLADYAKTSELPKGTAVTDATGET